MFEGLFQPMHLLVIFVIALIVFGPSKLPEMGSAPGRAIKDFKKAMAEPDQKSEGRIQGEKLEDKKV